VLAWSVDASRRHWLLQRVVPLFGVIVLLGTLSTQLVAAMLRLTHPGTDALEQAGFEAIPYTGLGPMGGGVSAFGITLVVGAMLGRLLPALLTAATFVLFATLLIQQGNERLMAGESLVADREFMGAGRPIDVLLRTPEGQILSWDEGFALYADPVTGELAPGITEVARYVPIAIYPEVAARYALLHLYVGLTALTLAFAVVERRGP
jgi:hypothetical protein